MIFDYRTITFFGASFQKLLLITQFVTFLEIYIPALQPHYVLLHMVWASLISLAATMRILILVYFPPGTKRFQFPGCAPPT